LRQKTDPEIHTLGKAGVNGLGLRVFLLFVFNLHSLRIPQPGQLTCFSIILAIVHSRVFLMAARP
jgi:hypothetical protein